MNKSVRNLVLLGLMVCSSAMAMVLRPTQRIADMGPAVNLETLVPRQFGDWVVDDKVVYQQVSPDVSAALAKIYTQVLTRTYVNKAGYRIMLSVPYGANQSDGVEFRVFTVDFTTGEERLLFSELLRPLERRADRGDHMGEVIVPSGVTVIFETAPGPSRRNSWDWSYWRSISLVPEWRR